MFSVFCKIYKNPKSRHLANLAFYHQLFMILPNSLSRRYCGSAKWQHALKMTSCFYSQRVLTQCLKAALWIQAPLVPTGLLRLVPPSLVRWFPRILKLVRLCGPQHIKIYRNIQQIRDGLTK